MNFEYKSIRRLIGASDYEASRAFYTELGFMESQEHIHWVLAYNLCTYVWRS